MTLHYREMPHNPLRATPIMVSTRTGRRSIYLTGGKRAFDLALCILSAPFALPLIAVLALLVVLRDGKNPFYRQRRVGRHGRIYTMWKLRTMICDADAQLEAYLARDPDARREWDKHQKLKCDPRITRMGRLLRRSSMDELPQLWNVMRGDMSLVGPRPMLPEQRALYPGQDYYDLHPGITGSWQVSDRNRSSFAERAGFDTSYRRTVSLREDIRILCATVRVVIRATGY